MLSLLFFRVAMAALVQQPGDSQAQVVTFAYPLQQLQGRVSLNANQEGGQPQVATVQFLKSLRQQQPSGEGTALSVDFVPTIQGTTDFAFSPDGNVLALNNRDNWVVRYLGAEDDGLGATMGALNPALRTQLRLGSECQGVAVTNIVPGGPADRVGLKVNDLLLSLGKLPINTPDDLATHLKAVGDQPLGLQIIREGKTQTISVKPQTRVTLAPGDPPKPHYFIGVQAAPVDQLLRAHLKLPDGQGLTINEVVDDSPAKRADIKTGDILLEFDGKPLTDVETLMNQVQAVADKTVALKLVREGKEIQIAISPAPRPGEASQPQHAFMYMLDASHANGNADQVHLSQLADLRGLVLQDEALNSGADKLARLVLRRAAVQAVDNPAKSIEQLVKEVEELKRAVEELRKTVEAGRK
jgi:S1-C subfamily serine protease